MTPKEWKEEQSKSSTTIFFFIQEDIIYILRNKVGTKDALHGQVETVFENITIPKTNMNQSEDRFLMRKSKIIFI